jgi:ketosteroid isomerase-like protein
VSRWNAHDLDGVLALVTEDIVWEDPSIDGTARGLADARRYIESLFRAFPDIAWAMPAGLFVSLDDDREIVKVGQPWTCRGTALGPIDPPGFAPTGKPFELEGFDVWDLQRSDGRVRQVVSHYDALEFTRRVGLMPARGSGGERVLVRLQRLQARLRR